MLTVDRATVSFAVLARQALGAAAHFVRSVCEWPDNLRDVLYERLHRVTPAYEPAQSRAGKTAELNHALSLELAQLVRANWDIS